MKILALDSSCITAAVAVIETKEDIETKLLGEFITNHKKTHSQKLLPMIEQLMQSIGIEMGEIDLFAASSGPGSFTGLRIGIVTAKGFAYALKKPIVTEKTSNLEISQNTYVFTVAPDATKIDIKKAVLDLYRVEVESVNVLHTREKFKY